MKKKSNNILVMTEIAFFTLPLLFSIATLVSGNTEKKASFIIELTPLTFVYIVSQGIIVIVSIYILLLMTIYIYVILMSHLIKSFIK